METNRVQKIGYSRGSLWAPFHAVGMVASLRWAPPPDQVRVALGYLATLYPALASRVRLESDGSAWLTTDEVDGLTLEVRPRASEDQWSQLFLEQERIPFAIERGPLARCFLLQDEERSDLVVIVPHVIADGYGMTQVMGEALALLADPGRRVTCPAPAPPITWQSVAHQPDDNRFLRGFVKIANRVWPNDHDGMHQERYEEVNRRYWAGRRNGLLAFTLTPDQTSRLTLRCREHGVSVTSALVASVLAAEHSIPAAAKAIGRHVTIAVNIRERVLNPPEQALAVYASSFELKPRARPGVPLWEVARHVHVDIRKALGDQSRILWPLALGELRPAIADEMLAALCSAPLGSGLERLASVLRIGGVAPGLDVSNIGRVDLPEASMTARLEALVPLPPLGAGGGLALNVLTVGGKMSVVMKYREDQIDRAAVTQIKDSVIATALGSGILDTAQVS